jgi:hypothetical protein
MLKVIDKVYNNCVIYKDIDQELKDRAVAAKLGDKAEIQLVQDFTESSGITHVLCRGKMLPISPLTHIWKTPANEWAHQRFEQFDQSQMSTLITKRVETIIDKRMTKRQQKLELLIPLDQQQQQAPPQQPQQNRYHNYDHHQDNYHHHNIKTTTTTTTTITNNNSITFHNNNSITFHNNHSISMSRSSTNNV